MVASGSRSLWTGQGRTLKQLRRRNSRNILLPKVSMTYRVILCHRFDASVWSMTHQFRILECGDQKPRSPGRSGLSRGIADECVDSAMCHTLGTVTCSNRL